MLALLAQLIPPELTDRKKLAVLTGGGLFPDASSDGFDPPGHRDAVEFHSPSLAGLFSRARRLVRSLAAGSNRIPAHREWNSQREIREETKPCCVHFAGRTIKPREARMRVVPLEAPPVLTLESNQANGSAVCSVPGLLCSYRQQLEFGNVDWLNFTNSKELDRTMLRTLLFLFEFDHRRRRACSISTEIPNSQGRASSCAFGRETGLSCLPARVSRVMN